MPAILVTGQLCQPCQVIEVAGIQGPPGADGAPGPAGQDGADGAPGTPGTSTPIQVYTGVVPPAGPDDETKAALFYPTGGGTLKQWDVASGMWV